MLMGPTHPDPSVNAGTVEIDVVGSTASAKFEPMSTVQVKGLPVDWNYY